MFHTTAMEAHHVSRPNECGIGRHHGVAFSRWGEPVRVIEKHRDGIYETPLETFTQTGDVRVEGTISDDQALIEVEGRIARTAARQEPWDLLTNNCEHFAREVFDGHRASFQVRTGLVLAGLAVLIWSSSRE